MGRQLLNVAVYYGATCIALILLRIGAHLFNMQLILGWGRGSDALITFESVVMILIALTFASGFAIWLIWRTIRRLEGQIAFKPMASVLASVGTVLSYGVGSAALRGIMSDAPPNALEIILVLAIALVIFAFVPGALAEAVFRSSPRHGASPPVAADKAGQ